MIFFLSSTSGNDFGLLCEVVAPGVSVVVGGAQEDLVQHVDECTSAVQHQSAAFRALRHDRLVYIAPHAGTGSLGPESINEGLNCLLEQDPDSM